MPDFRDIEARLQAHVAVEQWARTFLKPSPEAYIRKVLDTTARRLTPELEPIVRRVGQAFFRDWAEEDNDLLASHVSTPGFELFLDDLSLANRNDLATIAGHFAERSISVEPNRDAIRVTYPNAASCTWRVICQDGEICTITGRAISRHGPVDASTADMVLQEAYAFLVVCAQHSGLHRSARSQRDEEQQDV